MSYETITVEADDAFFRLTLNRPQSLNSFNQTMHQELLDALEALRDGGECRALLLTGSGRGFCAGQDLSDKSVVPDEGPVNLGDIIRYRYNRLIATLAELPFPVVCAVNGVAAGAGANVAFACDIVLAARSAKFIQAFSKIGLVPDSGGTWMLPRLVGTPRAKALALLGSPVTADQAADWGMIWNAVDDERLMDEAETLCRELAAAPTIGLRLIKQALLASASNTLDEQLELEAMLQQQAGETSDFMEGVRAFAEKRAPSFTGS